MISGSLPFAVGHRTVSTEQCWSLSSWILCTDVMLRLSKSWQLCDLHINRVGNVYFEKLGPEWFLSFFLDAFLLLYIYWVLKNENRKACFLILKGTVFFFPTVFRIAFSLPLMNTCKVAIKRSDTGYLSLSSLCPLIILSRLKITLTNLLIQWLSIFT